MLSLQTILHPTDFLECSAYAFQLACALARDHGARLLVLHVPVPPPLVTYGELEKALQAPGGYRATLLDQLNRLQPADPGIGVEHLLQEGDPATEILQVAQARLCDLIVMGTHGRTGLSRLLVGSVAETVLRHAPCPVLLVKAAAAQASLHESTPSES
jgi:nucleotide-binding universal stress UspA family protein